MGKAKCAGYLGIVNAKRTSPEMLPTAWTQDGFVRAVDQEHFMFQVGIDDFADTGDGDAFDRGRKVIGDDDQFVLLATVKNVGILGACRGGKALLVDPCGHFGFFDDMREVGRETVTDIDHRVRTVREGLAYAVWWLGIEM